MWLVRCGHLRQFGNAEQDAYLIFCAQAREI